MPKSNNGTDKPVPRKKRGSARSVIHFPDTHPVQPQTTSFGSVLQKYRIEANLSQKELADLMAASRNTIANWENDRSKPDYDGIQALCRILAIPVQELFAMDNDNAVSPQELVILRIFRKLSPVGQRTFSKLINLYLQEELEERDRYLQESFCVLGIQATPAAAGTGCAFLDNAPDYVFIKKPP